MKTELMPYPWQYVSDKRLTVTDKDGVALMSLTKGQEFFTVTKGGRLYINAPGGYSRLSRVSEARLRERAEPFDASKVRSNAKRRTRTSDGKLASTFLKPKAAAAALKKSKGLILRSFRSFLADALGPRSDGSVENIEDVVKDTQLGVKTTVVTSKDEAGQLEVSLLVSNPGGATPPSLLLSVFVPNPGKPELIERTRLVNDLRLYQARARVSLMRRTGLQIEPVARANKVRLIHGALNGWYLNWSYRFENPDKLSAVTKTKDVTDLKRPN